MLQNAIVFVLPSGLTSALLPNTDIPYKWKSEESHEKEEILLVSVNGFSSATYKINESKEHNDQSVREKQENE